MDYVRAGHYRPLHHDYHALRRNLIYELFVVLKKVLMVSQNTVLLPSNELKVSYSPDSNKGHFGCLCVYVCFLTCPPNWWLEQMWRVTHPTHHSASEDLLLHRDLWPLLTDIKNEAPYSKRFCLSKHSVMLPPLLNGLLIRSIFTKHV